MPPGSVGAKSGEPRTHTLSYAKDGADYLIVASNAGARRNPAWYHNVKAHPDLEINVGAKRFPVRASIIGPDHEYPSWVELILTATEGSTHGYDVTDPTTVSAERRTSEARLGSALTDSMATRSARSARTCGCWAWTMSARLTAAA